jgi:hypothetical protein
MVFDAALASARVIARRRAELAEVVRVVEQRAAEGRATADDARRYRLALLSQSLLDSPGRLPYVPAAAERILATRRALAVERIVVGPEVSGQPVVQ